VYRGERAAGRAFLGVVFSDVPGSLKSSEHSAVLSVFRQKYRSCMSALACKIERFCLVPSYGQKATVCSMSWYRFVEGKIVEDWGTEVFWSTGTPESEIGEWHGNR
jgi:hypothetical protein